MSPHLFCGYFSLCKESWTDPFVCRSSKRSWRATRCCQRAACWLRFPEDQRAFWSCSQPTPGCEEAQQPMPALDFRRTSLNATTSDLKAETAKTDPARQSRLLTSLFLPNPTSSTFISVQSWQFFHPFLPSSRQHVHSVICTLSLTARPPHAPFTVTLNPFRNVHYCLWVIQSAVRLVVCVADERVWNVPPMVSLMCVLLTMELVEGAPRNCSRTNSSGGYITENLGGSWAKFID